MHIHTQRCKMERFLFQSSPKEDCIIIKSGSNPSLLPFFGAFFKLLVILLKFYGCDKSSPVLLSEKPPKSIRIPKVCRLQKKFPHRLSDTLEYRLNADTYLLDPLLPVSLCTTPNVLAVQMVTVCPHFVKMQFSFGCRTSTTRAAASSLPPLFRVFRADGDNDYATIKRCPPAEKTTIS